MPGIIEMYQLVDSAHPVILKVTVGDAGIAETTVMIDGIRKGVYSNSFETELGPNVGLVGKKLEIRSYVGKIIPDNNHYSETVTLSGGYAEREYNMQAQSPDNPVVFLITIYLIL